MTKKPTEKAGSTYFLSPAAKRRYARKKAREEARWKRMNGPVTTRNIYDEEKEE